MSDTLANPSMVTYEDAEGKATEIRDAPSLDPPIGHRVTVYEYRYERPAAAFGFEHDAANGLFRLTSADGTVEVFRDKPTRHLCVEPDEAGAMRPVTRHGRPVFLYLCREEREVR